MVSSRPSEDLMAHTPIELPKRGNNWYKYKYKKMA